MIVFEVREQGISDSSLGKLRFAGIEKDGAVTHAQGIFRDEKLVCVINEVDRVAVDWTSVAKPKKKAA